MTERFSEPAPPAEPAPSDPAAEDERRFARESDRAATSPQA